jgi:hypothetical protein
MITHFNIKTKWRGGREGRGVTKDGFVCGGEGKRTLRKWTAEFGFCTTNVRFSFTAANMTGELVTAAAVYDGRKEGQEGRKEGLMDQFGLVVIPRAAAAAIRIFRAR